MLARPKLSPKIPEGPAETPTFRPGVAFLYTSYYSV